MILTTGRLQPKTFQLDEARDRGDDSFCTCSSNAFMDNFPSFEGWEAGDTEPILLKLKNVEPHSDVWVGKGSEPRTRRAIFWLLQGGETYSGQGIFFGCGRKHIRMRHGDFVVFNDSISHWVMSNTKWYGAAIQLRKVK